MGARPSGRPLTTMMLRGIETARERRDRKQHGRPRAVQARNVKSENHVAANALYFLRDNFARIHGTLRVTPAMAAGIANRASGALKKCRAARQGG